ncbi:Potassium transporter [Sarracenia purpurea var. burkii]
MKGPKFAGNDAEADLEKDSMLSSGYVSGDRRIGNGDGNGEVEIMELRKRIPSFSHLCRSPPKKPKEVYHCLQTVQLAYQSLGIVYGDLGTSPMNVFPSITLSNLDEEVLLGILSIIFWTLTSIGLIKYVFIVLAADDHGEGGTFALYSLLSRHLNLQTKLGTQNANMESDAGIADCYGQGSRIKTWTKNFLEKSSTAQSFLIFVVLLGTCMVIGDGALTATTCGE